ncbi:hypothetical protein Pan216_14640 [Planctomycetes bacterium Pan216]|uniref:Legionella pneumophila major outer membrane protein n=1 Tax=Kolteria novifilia TaxID=2527975 RepID=A0A518B0Y5_9BACT|nr:hypothetical protein Pan216_14640 [Planctomycetes bacterium Pan216]
MMVRTLMAIAALLTACGATSAEERGSSPTETPSSFFTFTSTVDEAPPATAAPNQPTEVVTDPEDLLSSHLVGENWENVSTIGPSYRVEYVNPYKAWYADADAKFLWISNPGSLQIASEGTVFNPTPPPIFDPPLATLNADQLDFPFGAGGQIRIGRFVNRDTSAEFFYYGIAPSRAEALLVVPVDVTGASDFLPGAVTTIDGERGVNAFYSFRINNFDTNLRRWIDLRNNKKASLFAGFRFTNIQEYFGLDNSFIPGTNANNGISYDGGIFRNRTSTRNYLLGLDVGGTLDVIKWGPVDFGVRGSTAFMANFASMNSQQFSTTDSVLVAFPSIVVPPERNASDTEFSFMLELGLQTKLRLCRNLWARIGYDFTVITGLALASEQLTANYLVPGGSATVVQDGARFLHGPTIGLGVEW